MGEEKEEVEERKGGEGETFIRSWCLLAFGDLTKFC